MRPIIILLLPALAYASITVNIKAAPSEAKSLVTEYGKDSNIITAQEIKTFNLTDNILKEALAIYSGGKPLDVFVKSPTPWGDLYKTYDWQQVRRETTVKRTKIIKLETKEVTLTKALYANHNNTQKTVFTTNLSSEVENHVIKAFRGKNMSLDVQYKVDFVLHNRSLHLNFSTHFGDVIKVNDAKTMETVSEVEFTLEPNTSAKAVLNATRVTMVVQVDYETRIRGYLAVNYNPRHNGHHFWAYDVVAVLKKANKCSVEKASEVVTVQYFSDGKVIVANMVTGEIIKSEDAQYVD